MAIIDHTNNSIQQELRDVSVASWELEGNLYSSGLVPTKSSRRSTGTYWKYDKRYFLSTQVQTRAVGSVPPVAKYEATTDVYNIAQKHLSVAVTEEEIVEASDELEPLRDATLFLTNNFIVDYELDFANSYVSDDIWDFQATGLDSAVTGISGDVTQPISGTPATFERFDRATADPIKVLLQAIRTIQLDTGIRPNKLLIPRIVFDALRENPNVIQWASNTIGLNGGDEQVKAILALQLGMAMDNIKVVEFVYQDVTGVALANRDAQNMNFGQTATPTFGAMKWAIEKACLLMYSSDSFGKFSKTACACMKWDGLTSTLTRADSALKMKGGVDSGNLMIRSRYIPDNFTHYVDGYFAYDHKVISANLGFYLKNCIS